MLSGTEQFGKPGSHPVPQTIDPSGPWLVESINLTAGKTALIHSGGNMAKDTVIFIPVGQTATVTVTAEGATITVQDAPEIQPMGGSPGDPPKED